MYLNLFPNSSLFFVIILTLIHVPTSLCADDEQYVTCGEPFSCANIQNITYPFWGDSRSVNCGYPGFELLYCQGDAPLITIESLQYLVLAIDYTTPTLTVAREDLWYNTCPTHLYNTTLNSTGPFSYASNEANLTLHYGCSVIQNQTQLVAHQFTCNASSLGYFFLTDTTSSNSIDLESCTNVTVPVNQTSAMAILSSTASESNLEAALAGGFGLVWSANDRECSQCVESGGRCGYDTYSTSFACYCTDQPHSLTCNPDQSGSGGFGLVWSANDTECSQCVESGERCGFNTNSTSFTCYCTDQPHSLNCNPDQSGSGGFGLVWSANDWECSQCVESGGRCGYNTNSTSFACYCTDQPHSLTCNPDQSGSGGSRNNAFLYPFVIVSPIVGITILLFVRICCVRRRWLSIKTTALRNKVEMNHQKVEALIKNCGSLTPKRYSYRDIKKMTNTFKDKLGQGGYGGVFKGNLSDGRVVAVKVLNEAKGDGEEFINEVASISRTSHVNVVTLLGFCFEGSKRALIYEFMSNKSLDKFICNDGCRLDWKTLYQVSVGIARGLEYLHRGCNTRIVHFDIKPHNILLDEDFCPKISDFGLAKLCKRKESVVSMLGARGTPGYIAPEVFFRNFGGVSNKSDVYSYGMMVLEMVGARENVEGGVARTTEIYFPDWIYEHLELGDDLRRYGVTTEEEEETVRKMILVSLWCIQTNPSDRPSMGKVVEMLEGSLQSLQIPPKPFMFSPMRPAQVSSGSVSQSWDTIVELGYNC